MKAISYVISPDLLLDFLDHKGYKEIEIVVGENLTESYRDDLKQKGIIATERLLELVDKGMLRVYIPTRSAQTIHTKMYILEKPGVFRVIQSSANLTPTAQEARNQINYSWYFDLPVGHPLLEKILSDYKDHLGLCTLFLDDLRNLLRQEPDTDRKQIIEAWLKGSLVSEEPDIEIRSMLHELVASMVQFNDSKEETITVLKLPESDLARKRVERNLSPLNLMPVGQNQVRIEKANFIRYVYENHHIPFMILSREKKQLLLGMEMPMKVLNEEPLEPSVVNQGLESLEDYLNTIDSAESPEPLFAKISMFEALLYLFFSPFAHEYMKARRARFHLIDKRGPRFLYIYGPSLNGKTTFLRFSLKLLTGKEIEPLSRQDFTKTRVSNTLLTETAFPLVFDDIDLSGTRGIEDMFKSYWERMWREQYVWPQIIMSSNTARLKEWAKSRVKRIDFNVHFVPSETNKENLAILFSKDIPVFKWFAHGFINHLDDKELSNDDELHVARIVMKELYKFANRELPGFFPSRPLEEIYDPGKRDWQDLLFGIKKATIHSEGKRKLVNFLNDMRPWEVMDYQGYLPQTIKYTRKGNTIIIENPREFDKWLGKPLKEPLFISKLFGKKR